MSIVSRITPRVAAACLFLAAPLLAQTPADTGQAPDSLRARRGGEVLIPLGSALLPGLGQYLYGAIPQGLAYSAVGVAEYAIEEPEYPGDFPRRSRDQAVSALAHTGQTAAFLSAWDAFQRGVPAQQARGRYQFLPERRESLGSLLGAPFDARFLRRWTTWVDLGQTAIITALVLSERERGRDYLPFRGNDAAYAGATSMNAAVGEEALFRGWLLPMLTQKAGQRFWVANGIQASAFGAAHLPDASWGAAYIGAWALWEGWITRRNDWSVRESIFHHFWYDAAVFTASMLVDDKREEATRTLSFPTLRF
ncbi:MAG TPA: CPBP family intramembrane glutamic endopeptidase, partial [Gemmatimonadaceae bacterium]|nr:CPBP family intramembrane glutamic endopeptidase [Gemmatimonadaceae bacterium]